LNKLDKPKKICTIFGNGHGHYMVNDFDTYKDAYKELIKFFKMYPETAPSKITLAPRGYYYRLTIRI